MAAREQTQEKTKVENPFVQELMGKISEVAKEKGFIPVETGAQEKVTNPELQIVVDKVLKNLVFVV